MDITTFRRLLTDHNTELVRYISRNLPIKAGAAARSFVRENFRLGGFRDGAITKWQVTRRQLTGKGADAKRGPLLSSRRVLYSGTNYTPGNGKVTIYNDVAYAAIHNEGGTVSPRVTPKMRKYAWARYYEAGGGKKNNRASAEARMWKGLALTKKQRLNIKIPQRRFLGPSKTLDVSIEKMIEKDLNTLLKK